MLVSSATVTAYKVRSILRQESVMRQKGELALYATTPKYEKSKIAATIKSFWHFAKEYKFDVLDDIEFEVSEMATWFTALRRGERCMRDVGVQLIASRTEHEARSKEHGPSC